VIVACFNQSTGSFVFLRRALGELCSQSQIKHVSALKLLSLCYKRTGSCFQLCVYRLMDALGKFGEHSRIQSYPRLRVKQLLCFFFALYKLPLCIHSLLYNNASSSRILVVFRLFSIRGQTYDWRHHFKVFPSVFKVAEGFKNLRYYFTWRGKDKVQKSLVEALNRYESVGEERKSRFFVTNWLREKILEQSESTVERD